MPTDPLAVAVIETDAFCDHCGYNLRTQRVWRDERLDIPVCRCPDCGHHQAAWTSTSVTNAWLRRLATLGLLVWVVLGLALVAGTGLLMFSAHVAAVGGLSSSELETRDGRLVEQFFHNNAMVFRRVDPQTVQAGRFVLPTPSNPPPSTGPAEETFTADQVVYRRRLAGWLTGREPFTWGGVGYRPHYWTSSPVETLFVGGLIAVPLAFAAVVMACVSWFWPRRRRAVWLALPVQATTLAYLTFTAGNTSLYYSGVDRAGDEVVAGLIATVGLLQLMLVTAGLLLGRPIARGLVRTFVPPGARPLLAFLWHADGKAFPKTTPPTRSASAASSSV